MIPPQPNWVSAVLNEYEDVFQEPQGLPPSRWHDHAIVLKEGANIPLLSQPIKTNKVLPLIPLFVSNLIIIATNPIS